MVTVAKSAEWLRKVNGTIGGSSAAAAIGESRWRRTPMDVYRSLRGVMQGEQPVPLKPNDDMRAGIIYEPVAFEQLQHETGLVMLPHDQDAFCRRNEYPWAHCLPDGWVSDRAIVEIKCVRTPVWSKLNMGEFPRDWMIQAQHNMAVASADVCHFGVMDRLSARVVHWPVERDNAEIDRIMEKESALWDRVQKGTPPEFTDPALDDYQGEPAAEGETPTNFDDTEVANLMRQFMRLRDIESEAKDCADGAKARLLAAMEKLGSPSYFEILGVGFTDHSGKEYPNVRCHWRERAGSRQFQKKEGLAALAKAAELIPQLMHASIAPAVALQAGELTGLIMREQARGDDAWCKRGKPSRPLLVYPGRNR